MNGVRKDSENPAASGGFVLSLDFELMWGKISNPDHRDYAPNVLGARAAIPRLLELFRSRHMACTWATTGLLFFDRRDQLLSALPELRPTYADESLSSYAYLDEVGASEETDPIHFGLSLIRMIKNCPRQEIGTHTFSHYFCADAGDDGASLQADLDAARKAAATDGIEFTSIVFPRNQVCDYALAVCKQNGFTCFRGNPSGWAYNEGNLERSNPLKRLFRLLDCYLPLRRDLSVQPTLEGGMVNVAASCFLRPYSSKLAMIEPLRVKRIKKAMRLAAKKGNVFHLWFHPHNFGSDLDENIGIMGTIAEEAGRLDREFGWPSRTMSEVASQVLSMQPPGIEPDHQHTTVKA